MLITLLGMFVAGVMLSFTPCTLPMLGIMAGILTGPEVPITSRRGLQLASVYVLASSLCYSLLGAVSGLTGTFLQGAMHTPLIVVPMALLLVLLALMQLDIIKFNFRSFGFLDKIGISRDSLTGSSLLGVLSVITMSPCVTPVIAGIIAYIGTSGAVGVGVGALQLFVMGLGMGVPLLLLALFGGYMIPRAGSWMKYVKYTTSLVLFGLSVHLLYGLVPQADPLAYSTQKIEQSSFNSKAVSSVDQLQLVVKSADKPVLVVVHANWCPWCTKQINDMKGNSKLMDKLAGYQIVSVDLTSKSADNTALFKELVKGTKEMGLPLTVKYIKGERVNVKSGYLSPEKLLEF